MWEKNLFFLPLKRQETKAMIKLIEEQTEKEKDQHNLIQEQ